jgi:hypothetical protein
MDRENFRVFAGIDDAGVIQRSDSEDVRFVYFVVGPQSNQQGHPRSLGS